jgi:GH25 family lysozyme M1 (1,4-beta-N-acetylmuramidase)
MTEEEKKTKLLYGDCALVLDASKYQHELDEDELDSELDPGELSTAGITAVIHKITQGAYEVKGQDIDPRYCEREISLRAEGIDMMAYTWVDPIYSAQRHYDWNMRIIEKYGVTPSAFWLDIEQYWADWSNYNKLLSSKQISDVTQQLAEKMSAALDVPVGIYSRLSFMDAYSREMLKWVYKYPLWLASWLWKAGVEPLPDWDTFKAYKLPPDYSAPILPAGASAFTLWQFTGDRFRLPGIYARNRVPSPVDINLFNGTHDQYYQWLKGEYTPAPQIIPEDQEAIKKYKLVAYASSVRSGPGVEYPIIRYLKNGATVDVYGFDSTGRWAQISATEWVALWYSKGKIFQEVE